jgi:hypothetical protein
MVWMDRYGVKIPMPSDSLSAPGVGEHGAARSFSQLLALRVILGAGEAVVPATYRWMVQLRRKAGGLYGAVHDGTKRVRPSGSVAAG